MAMVETGPPTEYDTSAEDALTAAMEDAFQGYYQPPPARPPRRRPAPPAPPEAGGMPAPGVPGRPAPGAMRVTARIEWAGVDTGVRTTRLDGLDLRRVTAAHDRVLAAERRAQEARPATSYTATGWHAQIRALTAHGRGSQAADRAGLAPSARTLRRWLAEEQTPSRANQERIARAYEALRHDRVDRAHGTARAARHELTGELSRTLRDRYGSEIRLTDIRSLRFE